MSVDEGKDKSIQRKDVQTLRCGWRSMGLERGPVPTLCDDGLKVQKR